MKPFIFKQGRVLGRKAKVAIGLVLFVILLLIMFTLLKNAFLARLDRRMALPNAQKFVPDMQKLRAKIELVQPDIGAWESFTNGKAMDKVAKGGVKYHKKHSKR